MPVGDPGQEQFRRAIVKLRNLHIVAGLYPLILFRQELLADDELSNRGGMDDSTKKHFLKLLAYADRWRRRITHNPDNEPLGDKIQKAIDVDLSIEEGENPFGGDDIQNASGGLIDLPFALDGSDSDIPLMSALRLKSGNALILLGAVDRTIVQWTRLNSRDRTSFITRFDSMRIYGQYQQIYAYLISFAGDTQLVDVAQVLASEEPLGPDDSPNRKAEGTNPRPAG